MIFLMINLPNFAYLLVDPGNPPSLFLWSVAIRSPTEWTPQTDKTDKRTCLCGRLLRCLFDGVWH